MSVRPGRAEQSQGLKISQTKTKESCGNKEVPCNCQVLGQIQGQQLFSSQIDLNGSSRATPSVRECLEVTNPEAPQAMSFNSGWGVGSAGSQVAPGSIYSGFLFPLKESFTRNGNLAGKSLPESG